MRGEEPVRIRKCRRRKEEEEKKEEELSNPTGEMVRIYSVHRRQSRVGGMAVYLQWQVAERRR